VGSSPIVSTGSTRADTVPIASLRRRLLTMGVRAPRAGRRQGRFGCGAGRSLPRGRRTHQGL